MIQIAGHVPFVDSGALFFPALFEGGKLLLVTAGGADKGLLLPFYDHLHLLVAVRAAGVGGPGKGLPVAALPVLADQKLTVLSVDCQKKFAAARAFLAGNVLVAEGTVGGLDLRDQLLSITPDAGKKGFLL